MFFFSLCVIGYVKMECKLLVYKMKTIIVCVCARNLPRRVWLFPDWCEKKESAGYAAVSPCSERTYLSPTDGA